MVHLDIGSNNMYLQIQHVFTNTTCIYKYNMYVSECFRIFLGNVRLEVEL